MSDPLWYYQYDPIIDDHFDYSRFRSKINQYIATMGSNIAAKMPNFKRNWVTQSFWKLVQGKEPDVIDAYIAFTRSVAFDINYFIYQDASMILPEHIQLFQFWEYFLQHHLFEPRFKSLKIEVMERVASLSPFERVPADIPFLTSTYPITISTALTQKNVAQARSELKTGLVRNYMLITDLFRYLLPQQTKDASFFHIFDVHTPTYAGEILNLRRIFEETNQIVTAFNHNQFQYDKDAVIINHVSYPLVKLFSMYLNEMIFINGIQKVALNVIFNKKMGALT